MPKTYIVLLLLFFVVSAFGCATEATAYKASKDEIVNYKPAPEEAIVVFPKNFREPKKVNSSDKDVETYLRYANALDLYRYKFDQRRKEKKAEIEKRRLEWEAKKKAEEEERKREENAKVSSRMHTRWWRYSHNRRYVPWYWKAFYPIGPQFQYEWWDPCLPYTGHRIYLRAATYKRPNGPRNRPTTRGTTILNTGTITYPDK